VVNAAATGVPNSEFTLTVGARTDTGKVRANNQDAVRVWTDLPQTIPFAARGYLFAVADGVGGNEGGEIASALAMDNLFHTYYSGDTNDIAAALKIAVNVANDAVFEAGESQAEDRKMGTTLVAGVIRGGALTVANVGDSRAYLFRGRTQAAQITKDHSMVAEAVRAGQMTAEQARTSRQRNIITRALGNRHNVEVDIFEVDLLPDDVILLCSDGLYGTLEEPALKEVAQTVPPPVAANQLIDMANAHNASDNISAVIVQVTREGQPALQALPSAFQQNQLPTERITTVAPATRGTPVFAVIAAVVVLALIIAAVLLIFVFHVVKF